MGKKKTGKKERAEARMWEGGFVEVMNRQSAHSITCDSDKSARRHRELQNAAAFARGDGEYDGVVKSAMTEAIIKFNKSLEEATYRLQIEIEVGGGECDDPAQWEYGDSDQSAVKWPESQKLRSLVGKPRIMKSLSQIANTESPETACKSC